MPLRNFGLSFSRRGARGGIARPRHAAGIGFVLVLLLLVALWATLAHAASDYTVSPQLRLRGYETSIKLRQDARYSQLVGQ